LAIGIVPGNREEVGTHSTSIGDPHVWHRSALLADQPKGERNEEPKDNKSHLKIPGPGGGDRQADDLVVALSILRPAV
jgi:hypothetical protein